MEDMLEEKYTNIGNLNSAWGSNFASFAAINGNNSSAYTSTFTSDMNGYLDHFADTYYKLVSEEFRKVFPKHLYLGSRLFSKTFGNDIVMKAASRYCDIISVNIYVFSVEDFSFATDEDKPWLISEFHFGTGTNGVWGVGLRPALDLQNQADLYKQYIREAAGHPNFVGAHWFQWSDQPVMGRKDGENYRIGVLNITDQSYETMVSAITESSNTLYESRLNMETNDTSSAYAPESTANDPIHIYPNPNDGHFVVDMSLEHSVQLTLTSLSGRVVYSSEVKDNTRLTVPDHLGGVYTAVFNHGSHLVTKRVIIL